MQLCSCSYENEMFLDLPPSFPRIIFSEIFWTCWKKKKFLIQKKPIISPAVPWKRKRRQQRIVQVFNFVCIAAAILCGMINYLTREKLDWFWFAAAGCLCGWLIVAVAYAKRRNILKKRDHTVDPGNCYRCSVGQIYRMAWLVSGFCPSIWRSCSTWLYIPWS